MRQIILMMMMMMMRGSWARPTSSHTSPRNRTAECPWAAAVAAHTCRHPPLQRVHVCARMCTYVPIRALGAALSSQLQAAPVQPNRDAASREAAAGLHATEAGGGNSSPNDNKGNNVTKHVHELGMFIWICKECSHGDLSLWAAGVSRLPSLILLVFLLLSYWDWFIWIHDPFSCLHFHFLSFTLLHFLWNCFYLMIVV